jgi:hypothetical protein
MAKNVFPTENEVGSFYGTNSSFMMERICSDWNYYTRWCPKPNFIISGLELSVNLPLAGQVRVSSGIAMAKGYVAYNDSIHDITDIPVSSTRYIYLTLTRVSELVTTFTFTHNSTGTPPSNYSVELGRVTRGATTITDAYEAIDGTNIYASSYSGNDAASRFVYLGLQPRYVEVDGVYTGTGYSIAKSAYAVVGSSAYGWHIRAGDTQFRSNSINDRPELWEHGFYVGWSGSLGMNKSGETYQFIAYF